MPLTCPLCRVPMTERTAVVEVGPPVMVDICDQCHGLWLDAQKLAAVCPTVMDLPQRKTEIMLQGSPGAHVTVCPRCQAVPYELAIMEGMNVDFCVQCSGVWLDGDEYNESDFEPAPVRDRENSPYRSRGEEPDKPREVNCQGCARPVTVATSYVWESGFICRSCFALKQQRAQARRVDDSSGMVDLTDIVALFFGKEAYKYRK